VALAEKRKTGTKNEKDGEATVKEARSLKDMRQNLVKKHCRRTEGGEGWGVEGETQKRGA